MVAGTFSLHRIHRRDPLDAVHRTCDVADINHSPGFPALYSVAAVVCLHVSVTRRTPRSVTRLRLRNRLNLAPHRVATRGTPLTHVKYYLRSVCRRQLWCNSTSRASHLRPNSPSNASRQSCVCMSPPQRPAQVTDHCASSPSPYSQTIVSLGATRRLRPQRRLRYWLRYPRSQRDHCRHVACHHSSADA